VSDPEPLIVILGQTASGKSALALQLAQRFNGEIISADSRSIYKGMDIGTAKPSQQEQKLVTHHLIDIVTPDQPFTAADFQRLARQAIADIAHRGKLPILVGGTGLYIDSVIYNFSFRSVGEPEERRRLQAMPVEELQQELAEQGIALPANHQNPVQLIRALETKGQVSARTPLRRRTLIVGVHLEKDVLEQRIQARVESMVERGFIEEVRELARRYGWEAPALQAPGYKAFRPYLAGQIPLDNAKQLFVQNDLGYAKRQKTWFKRNPDIHWISSLEESVELITTFLNN
jgi:tRNA dimethylallyltransferase